MRNGLRPLLFGLIILLIQGTGGRVLSKRVWRCNPVSSFVQQQDFRERFGNKKEISEIFS